MSLSAVAAILDGYGGWHVVVGPLDQMHNHWRPGQKCLVVPDMWVQEPVSWNRIPYVIERAHRYIDEWIRMQNDPDLIDHPAVKLYRIRSTRGYQNNVSLDLHSIVET